MAKIENYIGKKINNWTILNRTKVNKIVQYEGVCNCIYKTKRTGGISSFKNSNSCVKCAKTRKIEKLKKEFIGMHNNKLTLTSFYGTRDECKNHEYYWVAKCDCGSEKKVMVTLNNFKKGKPKSCRCIERKLSDYHKRKKYNTFVKHEGYYIATTDNGEFLFDEEDYEKVLTIDKYWKITSNGHVVCYEKENNREYQLHRYLMGLGKYNRKNGLVVDHINGDKLDNRKNNLRVYHGSKNNINCKLSSRNTSGAKGVCWHKASLKWQASIKYNNKTIHLGVYSNFDDAVKARKEAEEEYFGEFARKEEK